MSLRHRSTPTPPNTDRHSDVATEFHALFDEYARVFKLNLNTDDFFTWRSFASVFERVFWQNYEVFHFRIVYFASIAAATLLIASVSVYVLLSKRLMMPRSFFHAYVNIWTCALLMVLIYTLGIHQTNLPHVCLSTAVLLHYLTLCASVWYTLYFYCLYQKLSTLKTRNFNLIFNKAEKNAKKRSPDDIGDDMAIGGGGEYIKKSVVHLYMLGWGIPSLLCSIIVSITKRDYIQAPYGHCFTNEPHILIGSLLVPVLVLFVIKVVFVVLIWVTLRKILVDLQEDKEVDSEDSDENENQKASLTLEELNDKVELCKKWAQHKTPGEPIIMGRNHKLDF